MACQAISRSMPHMPSHCLPHLLASHSTHVHTFLSDFLPLPSPSPWPALRLQVMRLECAAEFCEPVDLVAFPDYAEDIKQPMDLGTIKVGRRAGAGAHG